MDRQALYDNFENVKLGVYVPGGDVSQDERVRLMAELVASCGKRVLDAACFDGSISQKFLELGKEVYGFDIAPKAVELANKRGIKAVVLDWENNPKLPYKDGFFDCVVLGEFIEHVYEPEALLKETRRVLSKGGHAIITTPNLARLNNRFKLFFGGYPQYLEFRSNGAGHIRLFTYPALQELLSESGFKVVKRTSNTLVLPKRVFSKSIAKLFPSFGENIIVKAEAV